MLRKVFALLIAAGLLAALGGAGSAIFTDSKDVGSNTFTTGTVVLTTNPTSALVKYFAIKMAPGDVDTAPITVTNNGSLDLRYAVSSAADNTDNKGLAAQLVLTIKGPGTGTCDNTGFATYTGTQLYTGVLGSVAGTKVIGDPKTGQDTGDRPLAAGANETLCFHVSLPSDSGNAFQNATTTATFTFAAEQTKNN